MLARTLIRRQSYADVMAKTAANTVGGHAAGSAGSVGIIGTIAVGLLAGFALNQLTPSTQPASSYYNRLCAPGQQ